MAEVPYPPRSSIPAVAERDGREGIRQVEIAEEAGFLVIDMVHVYDHLENRSEVWLAEWDRHPNVKGHELIADMLYAGIMREMGLGEVGDGETSAAGQQSDSKGD